MRNISIDFYRGVAILLVVFGHTLSGIIENYQKTFFTI